jgi:hypothetical protein
MFEIDPIEAWDIDEEFEFEAVIETRITNLPGATGVAATFGRPFAKLADVVDLTNRRGDGELVQSAVNKAQAEAVSPTAEAPLRAASSTGGRLCGALGAETAALASLLLVFHLVRRGRSGV